MPRLCPRCKGALGDESKCPTCGFQQPTIENRRGVRARGVGLSKWQQTSWGKTLIGLVLSQGLWYSLMLLWRSVQSALGLEQEWTSTLGGMLVMQVMQLISLVIGGMLAGAGQKRGTLNGAIVGVYNAILFLLIFVVVLKNEIPPMAFIALPLLQVAFGTVGGFIGNQIWRPIQFTTTPREERLTDRAAAAAAAAKVPLRKPSPLAGPVAWLHVAAGVAVAVVGTIGAREVLRFIENIAQTPPETQYQAKFLTWEISALAMLVGGAIGGANTANGMKQGVFVGIFSCVALIGIYLVRGDATGTSAATLGFYLLGFEVHQGVALILFTIMAVMPLAVAGGWFGGQLLPPLVLPPRRLRMLTDN